MQIELQNWIRSQFGQTFSANDEAASPVTCAPPTHRANGTSLYPDDVTDGDAATDLRFGTQFYAFVTPFLLCVGLLGNGASLKVFQSPLMNRFSCTKYLVALSLSNIMVLLTYVLLDWLNDGLKYWPGGHR